MKGYHRYILYTVCTLLVCGLCGCGGREETGDGTSPYAAATGMEGTPIVDYTVPQMSPNILVDLYGYPAAGRKEAALKGSRLPESFRLIDSDTREAVYTEPSAILPTIGNRDCIWAGRISAILRKREASIWSAAISDSPIGFGSRSGSSGSFLKNSTRG